MNSGNLLFHGGRSRKAVALTFDDGPAEETDELLRMLKKENIKATFFVLGKRIAGRGKIIRRMIGDGHEIGNHSYSHKRLWFKSLRTIREDIQQCDNELWRNFGIKTKLFRPPYFAFGPSCWIAATNLGKKIIFSDTISQDWKRKGVDWTVSHTLERVRPGSIINLHDYLEGIGRNSEIIEITQRIIKGLKQKGYSFATVSHLLKTS